MNIKLEEKNFGFFKVASAIPEIKIADVYFNSKEIVRLSKEISERGAKLIVFPELSLTGYSCGDLFYQSNLLEASLNALGDIQNQTKELDCVVVLGLPIKVESKLYNSAAILFAGKILGVVPKSFIPNTNEFYEKRWFQSGSKLTGSEINFGKEKIPFGVDLIFSENSGNGISIGVEICEDLWMVSPPSIDSTLAGATIIANLSASNELLGKYEYRKSLIENQSAKCNAAYIYSSSGVNESSSDMVFSGHGIIAENGKILNETKRFCFSSDYVLTDIDLQILSSERLKNESFSEFEFSKNYRKIEFRFKEASILKSANSVSRVFIKNPFVPEKIDKRNHNCKEIISIQSYGLAKRLKSTGIQKVVLGVSGGLDSTLALLVSVESFRILGLPLKNIYAFSLPGFGTTDRTKNNSERLSGLLQISYETISIHESVAIHFKNIGQDPNQFDSTFENSQARERTQILMDLANKLGGIVVGTGDLSEIALGWCTYNADHISMYNVNCGVPKTLVRYLIKWFSENYFSEEVSKVLKDICNTPISPELLPSDGKEITQKTENIIGPYELHDFFLYYFIRFQFSPSKILFMAEKAYHSIYSRKEILKWMKLFFSRFFQNQFKRSAMPDGPKVGSVALSQRGDWRMPSDIDSSLWLREIEELSNF